MDCRIRKIGNNWHAAFKHGGKEYTHALRTTSEKEAEIRVGVIKDTLYRLEKGLLTVPDGADAKFFITSGGNLNRKVQEAPKLTVQGVADLFLNNMPAVEENTARTLRIHLAHLVRVLRPTTIFQNIDLAGIEAYAQARSKEKYRDKFITSKTIKKELQTFRQVWIWALERKRIDISLSWSIKSVNLPKDKSREPFRSFDQITMIIQRGKLTDEAIERLWETLYLNGHELEELLDHVKEHATVDWIYPLIYMVALTGCRRSEARRSLIDDWDFSTKHVMIREKKRDTSKEYTYRQIDIHPRLLATMQSWFAAHRVGQHAISDENGDPITPSMATDHLNRTLAKHVKYRHVRGYHTLRHSVASILASKGIDQRYVDKVLGHQTEDMRKRYQHLFPKGVEAAINALLG